MVLLQMEQKISFLQWGITIHICIIKSILIRQHIKVVIAYPQDYELIAVFMPSFLNNTNTLVYQAIGRGRRQDGEEEGYKEIAVIDLYPSEEEAYKCYQIMKEIYEQFLRNRKNFRLLFSHGIVLLFLKQTL